MALAAMILTAALVVIGSPPYGSRAPTTVPTLLSRSLINADSE